MKKVIKFTLFVLLVGFVIIGCSQDPKIEYVEVPCGDPNHGNDCTEEHADPNHDCGTEYTCESPNLMSCLKATSDSIRAVANLSQNCGCQDKSACARETISVYNSAALEAWSERGDGKTHSLATASSIDIPDRVSLRNETTGTQFSPCLSTAERTTAAGAAVLDFSSRH